MVDKLSENDLQQLRKAFEELDENHDGQVTLHELTNAVERAGQQVNHSQLEALLRMADIDGNGTLSYNELVLTSVQRRLSAKEERLWNAFCRIDINRDGKLTVQEIQSILGEEHVNAMKMVQEVDKDGDGQIGKTKKTIKHILIFLKFV